MPSLHDPVNRLHLINAASEKALQHLGIQKIEDLLFYFPRDWQDLSRIQTIAQIQPNELINVRARIKSLSGYRSPRRRMFLTEALLEDATGTIPAIWFNQPFLNRVLAKDREYYFTGKAAIYFGKSKKPALQLQSPSYELVKEETIHTAGIIPQYDLTEGITQKQLRYWLKQALAAVAGIIDFFPQSIRTKLELVDLKTALGSIHFPPDQKALQKARARLAFDELFLFQLALTSYKQKLARLPAPVISFNANLVKKFVAGLPFALTPSQRLAVWEILKNVASSHPMNRLLEGEVGSGKTVVAGIAMFEVAAAGWQSALLAPTEILAWQHYQTLKQLLEHHEDQIALLTRSHKMGNLADIAAGKTKIIIGTHALLQESVKFSRIGLLVVDEQHRFGVEQRGHLQSANQSGLVPHLLSMTATPIPRTLALAFYGDLDISELRELPRGRKKIITRLVEPAKRPLAYEFIKKQILAGRQAYVVTPLIGEDSPPPNLPPQGGGDKGKGDRDTKAAVTESEKLQKLFPQFHVGLLHGRLSGDEKKQIMTHFKSGKIQILVSTTVIEVGVDVPNATMMMIENAERFGLSQLHQLRGRVGRSEAQSYCLLFTEDPGETTLKRLKAVVDSTDGFALAEKDLELRGPGEIMGTRQSGYIPFKIAKLSDQKLIKLAKAEAEELLKHSPQLAEFPALKQKVAVLSRHAHLE